VLLAYASSSLSRRLLWFPLVQQALQVLPLLLLVPRFSSSRLMRLAGRRDFPRLGLFHSARWSPALLWIPATFVLLLPQYQPVEQDPTGRSDEFSRIMGDFTIADSDLDRFRFRSALPLLAVLLAFGLLFIRFVWLQVIQHDYYQTRAEDNRISLFPSCPTAASSPTATASVLARNYSAFTLEITPSKGDLDATIDGLAEVIDIQPKDRKRFKKLLDEAKNFESMPIRTRLTDEEVAKFAATAIVFPASRSRPGCSASIRWARSVRTPSATSAGSTERDLEVDRGSRASRPTTRAPTTSARPAWSSTTSSSCTARPATRRSKSMPAAVPCAACRAPAGFRATT
jgi:hypothetical protein